MMDELQMIRDLLPQQSPPASQVTTAARARLLACVAGQQPGNLGSWQHRIGSRLATTPRWRLAAPALATVTAAAVSATLLITGGLAAKGPGAPVPANLTARDVLLTAATAAAAAPDTGTAKYWRQTEISGFLLAAGPNSSPYVTERRTSPMTSWWPTSPGTLIVSRSTDYTTRLPTPGAAAAWRASGSPPLPQQSGRPPRASDDGPASLLLGNENLTLAQFRALPSSTTGLKQAIIKGLQAKSQDGGTYPAGDHGIIDVCVNLIQIGPVPPAVRAAAFRILATMPGIHLVGRVTDPLGRTGYGITLPYPVSLSPSVGAVGNNTTRKAQVRLVISASGALFAYEYVAAVPTTSLSPVMPASGAIPGPAICPAGSHLAKDGKECVVTRHYPATGVSRSGKRTHWITDLDETVLTLGAPVLAVPAGTVVDYDAYLDSGLTNEAPVLPTPRRPAPHKVFYSPTAPSASSSPSTRTPTPAQSTPRSSSSPSPSAPSPTPSPATSTASPSASASPAVPSSAP
jgi:hypothetical protein